MRLKMTEQNSATPAQIPEPILDGKGNGSEVAVSQSAGTIIPSALLAIERFLNDPRLDLDRAERLFAFQERLMARQAEIDFNAAKGRILKKLAGIKIVKNRTVLYEIEKGKPQKGTYEAFKYAPLEEIDKHLRPLLAEEDMDLSFSDDSRDGGGVLLRGRLKHLPGGHYEDSFMPAPLDTSGGKTNVQGVGSSNSFLRRYVSCNIFNIVVVGDDDDGSGGTIDAAQAKIIRELVISAGADEMRFLKFMKATTIDDIAFRDYRKAVSVLEKKINKERSQ